jgi:hypothetical protein
MPLAVFMAHLIYLGFISAPDDNLSFPQTKIILLENSLFFRHTETYKTRLWTKTFSCENSNESFQFKKFPICQAFGIC